MSLYVDIEKDFGRFHLRTKFEADGGVTGILGASGCGKSMTLRCIAGIVKPDRGRIELDGVVFFDSEKKINLKPQERHVGLLFQNYALFPNMTVRQNLMTGLLPWEKDRKKANLAIDQMLENFYLTDQEKHKPSQLSGGQQQRVALARILLSRPRMLMLDEPFSALDDYLRWNVELELKEVLQEFGGNTLFVSHSRDEVYRVCDRVCVMDHGTSSPVIPVKQMFEQPITRAAALLSGCKNYSRVHVDQEGRLQADDWGTSLVSSRPVPEKLRYVGVRSHFIHPVTASEAQTRGFGTCQAQDGAGDKSDGYPQNNLMECQILQVIEDVFSMVVMLQPVSAPASENGAEHNEQIRIEMPKAEWTDFCQKEPLLNTMWVEIAPEDVMLLE